MLSKHVNRALFKTITAVLVCLFIADDIAWAQSYPVYSNSSKTSTLAPELRSKPFSDATRLEFQQVYEMMLTAGKLKALIQNDEARPGNMARLNNELKARFPNGEVALETKLQNGALSTHTEYKYAVFHFKKENRSVEARFFKDDVRLTEDELAELGVKTDEDRRYFNASENLALRGVWFVNPDVSTATSVKDDNEVVATEQAAQERIRIIAPDDLAPFLNDLRNGVEYYEQSDWISQSGTREKLVPYLLRDDLLSQMRQIFEQILKKEERRASIEAVTIRKNILSLVRDVESQERSALEAKHNRLLGLEHTFEDILRNPERMERVIKICRAYFIDPTISSRELHNRLDRTAMKYDELIENYRVIQRLRILQDMFIYNSVYQRVTGYIKEQLMMPERLEAVFSKGRDSKVMPFAVEFHLALGCNAKCLGCPNIDKNRKFVPYEKVNVPLDLKRTKMLVDMFLNFGVERITFAGGGEPFACPFLVDIIKYTREKAPDINIALYTNGIGLVNLSEKDRRVLVSSLNRLRVSMDASSAADWAQYKGRDEELFSGIWKALGDLVILRDSLKSNIKLGASCIVSSSCQDRKVMDFIGLSMKHGLNFCDIKALSESEEGKAAFRADNVAIMQIMDEIMTSKKEGKYGKLDVMLEDVFVADWYAWKLGLKKTDLLMPHHCWMARMGRKLTIGPYGDMFPCSDAANPGVLRVLKGEPRMATLTHFEDSKALTDQFAAYWEKVRGKRDSFDPPTHPYCVPSNNDYNVSVEKLHVDWEYGIAMEDQPICPESYMYLESRGIAGTGSIKSDNRSVRYTTANRKALTKALRHLHDEFKSNNSLVYQMEDDSRIANEFVNIGSFAVPTLCDVLKRTKNVRLQAVILFILSKFKQDARIAIPIAVEIKGRIHRESFTRLNTRSGRFNSCMGCASSSDNCYGCVEKLNDCANLLIREAGFGSHEAAGAVKKDLELMIQYSKGRDKNMVDVSEFSELMGVIAGLGPAAKPIIPLAVRYISLAAFYDRDYEMIVNAAALLGEVAIPFKDIFIAKLRHEFEYCREIGSDFDFDRGTFKIGHTECLSGNILYYLASIVSFTGKFRYTSEDLLLVLEILDFTKSEYVLESATRALSTMIVHSGDHGHAYKVAGVIARVMPKIKNETTLHVLGTLCQIYKDTDLRLENTLIETFLKTENDRVICDLAGNLVRMDSDLTKYAPQLVEKMNGLKLRSKFVLAWLIRRTVKMEDKPDLDALTRALVDSWDTLEPNDDNKPSGWDGYRGVAERSADLAKEVHPDQGVSKSEPREEADRIHTENLKYTPTIPDKTILCHIITDSILPVGQRNMLKTLEQEMRNEKYSEKVISLSTSDSDASETFIAKLEALKAQIESQYKGYKVQFDVACPRQDLVERIQKQGMQALAFTKEGDGDIIQVEGIILALRALETGNISNLINVYKLLTGKEITANTADINELARMIMFVLPVRKVDVNEIGSINKIIEENIKTAA